MREKSRIFSPSLLSLPSSRLKPLLAEGVEDDGAGDGDDGVPVPVSTGAVIHLRATVFA
jgi:hypothetical protein